MWSRRFIIAFTSARHLCLSWARSIQSILSHPTSWWSILIVSSHLCLGLSSGLFQSGFPTKTLYTPLFAPIRSTCPTYLIPLDLITGEILGEEYKSFRSSLCSFLYSPFTWSRLLDSGSTNWNVKMSSTESWMTRDTACEELASHNFV